MKAVLVTAATLFAAGSAVAQGPDDGLRGLDRVASLECAMDIYGPVCNQRSTGAMEPLIAEAPAVEPSVWIFAAADYAARSYSAGIETASIPAPLAIQDPMMEDATIITMLEDSADAAADAASSLDVKMIETASIPSIHGRDWTSMRAASMFSMVEYVADLSALLAMHHDFAAIETATIRPTMKADRPAPIPLMLQFNEE